MLIEKMTTYNQVSVPPRCWVMFQAGKEETSWWSLHRMASIMRRRFSWIGVTSPAAMSVADWGKTKTMPNFCIHKIISLRFDHFGEEDSGIDMRAEVALILISLTQCFILFGGGFAFAERRDQRRDGVLLLPSKPLRGTRLWHIWRPHHCKVCVHWMISIAMMENGKI